jgi:large subunit ribosomal protein L9
MKVILKQNVYKHGVAGDVANVADGFARNYLIPRGLAVKASAGALRDNQHLMQSAALRRQELNSQLNEVARQIDGVELVFGVKAGKNGKLYGSITTMDVARALQEKTGLEVNRRRISEKSLRELGVYDLPVRMSADVAPTLRIVLLREDEVADYLAGKHVDSLDQAQAVEYVEYEEAEEEPTEEGAESAEEANA